MKKMLHLMVLWVSAICYIQAQTPGVSQYYEQTAGDTRNYIEYIPGNLPIIISAPHGGVLQSGETIGGIFYPNDDSSLPDRTCGNNNRDENTAILVREIQQEIFNLTGCYPHIIINNLHRSKLDPNSEINQATCGNTNAADYWNAFHSFIDQASASVANNWGKGLYIDVQAQNNSIPRIEINYNISAAELNSSNLNVVNIINKSTIRNLVNSNHNNRTYEDLVRGSESFGEMLQNAAGTFYTSLGNAGCGSANGYRAIPSATNSGGQDCDDTRPFNNAFTNGNNYNAVRHGSGIPASDGAGGGGSIDGILLEVNRRLLDLGTYNGQVFDSQPQTLVPFAKDAAAVILSYVSAHYNNYADFMYMATMYATNGLNPAPVLIGIPNGTFSAPAGISINATTGQIDVANSTPGNYTITYSVGDCGYFSSSQNITIVTDISQDTQPPTIPTGLIAVNTAETTTDLTWQSATDNVDLVGYNVYQDGVLISTVVSTNFVVTNLTPNTTYTFGITAIDLAGNESAVSATVDVTTLQNIVVNYCNSQSTSINDEFISRVQFADIDNISGAQFYSDFTNISTDVVKNGQYVLTVTPTWPATPFDESYAAWIDYNRDGDFNDAGEQVWSQGNTQQSPVSTTITIPTAVQNGVTRMRIGMKYNGAPTPCETFSYGEVEDYTINIVSAVSDMIPPILALLGENPKQILVNDTYIDAGATAIDNVDGDLTDVIEVTGTVNTAVEGTYILLYNVRDTANNQAVPMTRIVNVLVPVDDIPPVIALNGDAIINLNIGDSYAELGATATDNFDGDISANINRTGTVDTSVAGTYVIRYNVMDAAGNAAAEVTRTVAIVADTVIPVITLNGDVVVNLNVGDTYVELGATAIDNIDGDISANINATGTVDTTTVGTYFINYNVTDFAGNAAAEVTRTVIVTATEIGCTNGISTFPYQESFENTLGDWTQSAEDDIDWTLNAGRTPSNGTGPNAALDGNTYIYVEASGNGTGYPDKQAIITSPCFNLTQLTEATFSFSYHMLGTDMGIINLEISEDNGASWTNIWTKTGNQGNAWQTTNVDISNYTGSTVQFRFNRITGSTWRADIAIDNIRLLDEVISVEGCANGIATFPYTESFENTLGDWTQSTQDNLDWTIDQLGTPSNGTGPSTGATGDFYLYVEASGNTVGYPNKQAIINSPCFDLTTETNATFSFSYHIFGSNNSGTLSLDISTDNAQSWTTIWLESGNKGNQWNNATIDLTRYVGGSVQFRFNRVTGSTWQSDIAIDNISVNTTLMARQETVMTKKPMSEVPEDSGIAARLTLFPNPVKGAVLNVQLDRGTAQTYTIRNMYGQAIASGKATTQIQVDKLPSGVYIVEVFDGYQTFTKKIIKQ